MDQKQGQSRFPYGFLLIDKEQQECWIYDWHGSSHCFFVRDRFPAELINDPGAIRNRFKAAVGFDYDIRAWPL